jgi:hypothetical protein
MAAWWRDFQAHADAVDSAIEREHQAAISSGRPRPLGRKPEARHEGPDAAAPELEPQPGQSRPATPEASTEPESPASEPGTPESEAAGPVSADDGRAARLDELQARADEAARRIDAQRAQLDASSKHTARIEREAQAGSCPAGRYVLRNGPVGDQAALALTERADILRFQRAARALISAQLP